MCIHEIRAALGDDAEAPQYIETVGRQGYRFLSGPMRQAPAPASVGPVVGRRHEIAQLHQWYARAVGGERQFVVLSGELGIGKTTVVDLFLASLAPGARVGRGQCVEHYGEGEPYLPLLEALGRLGHGPGGDRVVAVLQRYAPLWLVQLSGLVPESELERVQRRVKGATAVRMLRELAEALEVLTTETPLVLVLEDLHWSDRRDGRAARLSGPTAWAGARAGAGDVSVGGRRRTVTSGTGACAGATRPRHVPGVSPRTAHGVRSRQLHGRPPGRAGDSSTRRTGVSAYRGQCAVHGQYRGASGATGAGNPPRVVLSM